MAIHLLDEQTINQIAAGEVVESPASVLKELVENAVDAGATLIEIEAIAGGMELLRLSDNGSGMILEDLEKCVLRHATSKLKSIEDLTHIQTMGFRGEALAAIAAVSHLKIQTSSQKEAHSGAWQLEVKGGVFIKIEPTSRSLGTTIEVRDLFFNTPARKVFQKGPSASASELTRVIGALALAYPHVQWSYKHGQRNVFHWPAFNPVASQYGLERCRSVLGENFATSAKPIYVERTGWKIKGWLSHPNEHRPSRQGQYWIINHRWVQAPQLGYWVQEGYGTRIPSGRFASFVLYVDLPGDWVDVNVHPQKKELRIKDPGWFGTWMAHQINLALSGTESTFDEALEFHKNETPIDSSAGADLLKSNFWDLPENKIEENTLESPKDDFLRESTSTDSYQAKFPHYNQGFSSFKKSIQNTPAFDFELRPLAIWKRFSLWSVDQLRERLPSWDKEMPQGSNPAVLAWMSASRALSRLRYEQAKQKNSQVLAHALLIPLRMEWRVDEMDQLMRHEEDFKRMGFEISALDKQSLNLHTLPVGLSENQARLFLEEWLHLVEKGKSFENENTALILAKFIENSEVGLLGAKENAPSDLILGLSNCPQPFYSPTGKAIFKSLTLGDLEIKGRRGDGV